MAYGAIIMALFSAARGKTFTLEWSATYHRRPLKFGYAVQQQLGQQEGTKMVCREGELEAVRGHPMPGRDHAGVVDKQGDPIGLAADGPRAFAYGG